MCVQFLLAWTSLAPVKGAVQEYKLIIPKIHHYILLVILFAVSYTFQLPLATQLNYLPSLWLNVTRVCLANQSQYLYKNGLEQFDNMRDGTDEQGC